MLELGKISYLIEAIEKNSTDKESLLYEFIDSNSFNDEIKIEALEYLVKNHKFDINTINSPLNIIEQSFRMDRFALFKALVKLGAKLNYSIARDLANRLSDEDIKELSPYLVKNHGEKLPDFCINLLDFDGFKNYIEQTRTLYDKGVLIALAKNTFISNDEKVQLIKLALDKGADINEQSKEGYKENLLYTYVKESKNINTQDEFLNFLVDNSANMQGENFSLLFDAIGENRYELIKYLLSKDADISYKDKKHSYHHNILYPLVEPRSKYENDDQRVKVLNLLVKKGLDIQSCIKHYQVKNTNYIIEDIFDICGVAFISQLIKSLAYTQLEKQILLYAIKNDISLEIQKELLSINPKIVLQEAYCNIRDEHLEYGILECAVFLKKEELVNYILDSFEDIKTYNEIYPLTLQAIKNGFSLDTAKRLINIEPNINRLYYIDPEHPHTLTMAVLLMYEYNEYKKLLSEDEILGLLGLMANLGLDFSIPLKDINPSEEFMDIQDIIYVHANNCETFDKKVVEFFYENGLDFTTPISNTSEAPIHSIIRKASDDISLNYLKFLDEKGVQLQLEHYNSLGATMFLTASSENKLQTLKYLANLGANIEAKWDEYTALALATIDNAKETIDTLIALGYDIKTTLDSIQFRKDVDMEHIMRLRYHLYKQFNIKDENQGSLEIIDILSREDMEQFKELTKENQNTSFKKLIYCYARDKYFDCSVLELAVILNKERFVLYILDNIKDIQTYSYVTPLLFWAIDYKFSFETIRKLILCDTNINQKYFTKGDDVFIENMATQFLRNYHQILDEQRRLEILKLMVQNGSKLSINVQREMSNYDINNYGIIYTHAIFSKELEFKILDFFLSCGIDPTKTKGNLNEVDIFHIISNRHISDEKALAYLRYLDDKGYEIDLKYKDTHGNDIFIIACELNKPLCVKWLAKKGANIHTKGGVHNSPALHKAMYRENDPLKKAQTVRSLCEFGCDIEELDYEQQTPLMRAAYYGCFESARVLLELGANPNAINEIGESVAHQTVLTSFANDNPNNPQLINSKILALLKDYGADLNYSSKHTAPLLHLCTMYKNKKEIFNTLLQLQIDINQSYYERTALVETLQFEDDIDFTNKLLELGADINILDKDGSSIHYYTLMRKNQEESKNLLAYFLEKDIPIKQRQNGFSLIHCAGYYLQVKALELLKDRVEEEINKMDDKGYTPLHYALSLRRLEDMGYSEEGYDFEFAYYEDFDHYGEYEDEEYEEPIYPDPREGERIAMVNHLYNLGADIHKPLPNGNTPLTLATLIKQKELSKVLIKLGCDVEETLNALEKYDDEIYEEDIEFLKEYL